MIACDTNVLIEYFAGTSVPEVARLDQELRAKNVALPQVVVTEILSDPLAPSQILQMSAPYLCSHRFPDIGSEPVAFDLAFAR